MSKVKPKVNRKKGNQWNIKQQRKINESKAGSFRKLIKLINAYSYSGGGRAEETDRDRQDNSNDNEYRSLCTG